MVVQTGPADVQNLGLAPGDADDRLDHRTADLVAILHQYGKPGVGAAGPFGHAEAAAQKCIMRPCSTGWPCCRPFRRQCGWCCQA